VIRYVLPGALVLLFLLAAIRMGARSDSIDITREAVEGLTRARQELAGRPLTETERRRLLAEYVSDEVLLREAYARELHLHDGQVRQRLIELMRFQLQEEPPAPDEKQLRNYLADHSDLYRTPAAVTFSHVYMSRQDGKTATDPDRVLAQLRRGVDFRRMGEDFWLGRRLERYDQPQLLQFFGQEFTTSILALPPGEWHGPIASTRGVHFVRVEERYPSALPPFETLVSTLRGDWLASTRAASFEHRVDELRRKYQIRFESGVER
jgi:peptidyl-prolyl cis-trans isomerase C